MRRTCLLVASFAALFAANRASAQTSTNAPAGGGLPSLSVKVDLENATLDANGSKIPITLDRANLPREGDVLAEVLSIGLGRHVVHVRVPARDDAGGIAWEAIVAGGRTAPIFAALTGLTAGDPGERTGKFLQIIADGSSRFVVVGDTREELQICSKNATLLEPLALYPGSLQLRPATVQRLSPEQLAMAQTLLATDTAHDGRMTSFRPLAQLLVARGSSVAGSTGSELTDGDERTLWVERRPGAGQGEFVVMVAPKEVRIPRMRIVVAPRGIDGSGNGAAPKSFYLVTDTQTFRIVLPDDVSSKRAKAYEIGFPRPLEASCLSLVLDGTCARSAAIHPDVGLAEITAYSEFDLPGATLDDVAIRLSGERGLAATQLLARAGGAALVAVEQTYERLDARGRALAVDVAAAREHCDEAAPLLARALCDEGEAARKAREKLARCKEAVPLLTRRLRDSASRACVAPLLASLDAEQALEPLADALADTDEGDRETRGALRAALGEALKAVPPARLSALLGNPRRTAVTRLEIMRAAKERVRESAAESDAALSQLLSGSPSMRARYLALDPLGELARGGDRAALARLVDAMTRDPEWPVRAHAADVAAGIDAGQAALVTAASDSAPRVREAALTALIGRGAPGSAEVAARAVSGRDGAPRWTFVITPAIAVLAGAPPSAKVDDALGAALRDHSAQVRVAVLVALASRHAASWRVGMRQRLADRSEEAEVRATAARALGAVCDAESVEPLTALARALSVPGQDAEEQQVAMGALFGLAALHPRDLRERVAPLLGATAPPQVRAAAQQAVSVIGACR